MKINKLFALGTLLLASLAFTACSDDDDWSGPGEVSDGAYLNSDASSFTFLPTDEESFTIQVGRTEGSTSTAQTVPLSIDDDAFSIPSSVDFAAGETKKDVKVTFDIPLGSTKTVHIAIADPNQASEYGYDTLSIRVNRDYNWLAAGSGTFTEASLSGASGTVVVQHADGTNLYRLVSPFNTVDKDDFSSKANIQFTLNDDGTIGFTDGIYDVIGYSDYEVYFDNGNYSDYCYVTNEDGTITWSYLLLHDTNQLAGPYSFSFEWLDGYPLDK